MMALQKRSFARQAGGPFWATVAESTNAYGEMWQTVVESTKFDLLSRLKAAKADGIPLILRAFGDQSMWGVRL